MFLVVIPWKRMSCNIYQLGCFLKWWYPQNTPKLSFLVGKPMVARYHHFRKPPLQFLTQSSALNSFTPDNVTPKKFSKRKPASLPTDIHDQSFSCQFSNTSSIRNSASKMQPAKKNMRVYTPEIYHTKNRIFEHFDTSPNP